MTKLTTRAGKVKYPYSPLLSPYDPSAATQLIPPAVLPEQFHGLIGRASVTRGEVALMRAILFDAVECFRKRAGAPSSEARRLAREAEQWLFTDDDRWPFSFVNVCAVLGLDPAYVRLGLQCWRQAPPACPPGRRLPRLAVPRVSSIAT